MAKSQASAKGTTPSKTPAKADKPASGKAIAHFTEIDTTGMSPEEIAALAEQSLQKRKPTLRNKNTDGKRKVSKKTAPDPKSVKSTAKSGKRPTGRPSVRNEGVIAKIVERLSTGEPLREICRDDNMPAWRTVYDWIAADKELAARIAHARELGEEALAQECLSIADDASNDWMEVHDKDGESIGWKLNGDHVQRSKLRIDTRLKLLAKWNPKKWGEKVDLNHGGQANNPLTMLLQQVNGSALPVKKDADES